MLTLVKNKEPLRLLQIEKNGDTLILSKWENDEQTLYSVGMSGGLVYFTRYTDAQDYVQLVIEKGYI